MTVHVLETTEMETKEDWCEFRKDKTYEDEKFLVQLLCAKMNKK